MRRRRGADALEPAGRGLRAAGHFHRCGRGRRHDHSADAAPAAVDRTRPANVADAAGLSHRREHRARTLVQPRAGARNSGFPGERRRAPSVDRAGDHRTQPHLG
ncbi:hypothetical protein G6F65_022231 [Rhizopus arrhizus]|nr:hypothetical protein G6F65_022231 [Rhizopus arrhizus]